MKTDAIERVLDISGGACAYGEIADARAELAALKERMTRLEAALQDTYEVVSEECGNLEHGSLGYIVAAQVRERLHDAHTDAITDTLSDTVPVERARLREIEWESEDLCQRAACPACFNARMDGHAPDCWLAAAIANGD